MTMPHTNRFSRILYTATLTFIVSAISSCGFTLRHSAHNGLDKNAVRIIDNSNDPVIKRAVSTQLAFYQAKKPRYTVTIISGHLSDQAFSQGANNNSLLSTLHYTLSYQLKNTQSKVLLPIKTIHLQRNYSINTNLLLGSRAQKNALSNELKQQALSQLFQRIQQKLRLN